MDKYILSGIRQWMEMSSKLEEAMEEFIPGGLNKQVEGVLYGDFEEEEEPLTMENLQEAIDRVARIMPGRRSVDRLTIRMSVPAKAKLKEKMVVEGRKLPTRDPSRLIRSLLGNPIVDCPALVYGLVAGNGHDYYVSDNVKVSIVGLATCDKACSDCRKTIYAACKVQYEGWGEEHADNPN